MLPLPSLSKAFAALLNLAAKVQPQIDITPLEGRSFTVAIDELPQDIAICVENGRVNAIADEQLADVDVIISGSLKAVIYMITHENDGLENDDLYIMGKISTARQFQHFLASLTLDWQGFFAQFMPDDKAAKAADAVEQGLHVAKGSAEQLGRGIKNYVINDKKWVVTNDELDALRADIQALNRRLDALLKPFEA